MNKKIITSIIIGLITSITASIIYDKLFKTQEDHDTPPRDRITINSEGGEINGVTNIVNDGSLEIKNTIIKP